jgi:hypothetical protein
MLRSCFLALVLTGVSYGADLTLPPNVAGDPGDFITIKATTLGTVVKWVTIDKGLKLFPTDLLKDSKTAIVTGQNPGVYRILAYTSDSNGPSDPVITTITINGTPTPTPGPTPPPNPNPLPFTAKKPANVFQAGNGFRVLVVYDTATITSLPAKQQDVIFGGTIRDYLNKTCVKGPDGTPDWRMWDQSIDGVSESEMWAKVMKRPRKSLPWLIVCNGVTAYEGPLPADANDMLTLLKKYGG